MEIFYHGSTVLFDRFDLSHALEGDGKAKFGFGVYVTEMFASAAHYAFNKKRPEAKPYYVYSIEVPEKTADNCLSLAKRLPVTPSIVERCEKKLGITFPSKAKEEGINFRKYLANKLLGNDWKETKMTEKASVEGEKAASAFLLSIGVEMIEWPYTWTKPEGQVNRAYLDDSKVHIIKIEEVELDNKKQFIPGSQKEVRL